jgi:hypothetical protein
MWLMAVMPVPGVGVGVAVGVGVGVAVGVGVGLGTGVGVGVGEAATVMLSEEEKKKPVESHARITMACLPAARDRMAVSDAFALWAFFTESIYMIIAVTVCSLSRAPAENVTGEVTVAPLAGEQILTVLSTVGVHTADAALADARRKVAARKPRKEITQGPVSEQKKELPDQLPISGHTGRLTHATPPRRPPNCSLK